MNSPSPPPTPAPPTELPSAIQVSGRDPDGRFILSVLAKRSYRWLGDGWQLHEEQVPLAVEAQADPDQPEVMLTDTDLHPFKCRTDLIVKGAAQGHGRGEFRVVVGIGNRGHAIDVIGDRYLERSPQGRLRYTPPQPIDVLPLSFAHAYGGTDRAAESKHGNPFLGLSEEFRGDDIDLRAASPFRYPRNPAGKGYLTEWPEDNSPVAMPNLEDPQDRLLPERAVAGDIDRWATMPVPVATDWFDYGWFPRNALFGFVPLFDPDAPRPRELETGGLPPEIWDEDFVATPASLFAGVNAAPLPLQYPLLRGPAKVELREIHPRLPRWVFGLPEDRPRLRVDGRGGKLADTEPVIHTIVVEPESDRVSILWRGSAVALRPYLPDELATMPFEANWSRATSFRPQADG